MILSLHLLVVGLSLYASFIHEKGLFILMLYDKKCRKNEVYFLSGVYQSYHNRTPEKVIFESRDKITIFLSRAKALGSTDFVGREILRSSFLAGFNNF